MNKPKNRFPRRATFLTLVTLIIVFIGIQFIRPVIANPASSAEIHAPAHVKVILKRACYNCHSNQTSFPWYDKIAPAYWIVANDVKQGREGLNFSTFAKMAPADQKAKLWEAVNQIAAGAMPLKSYEFVHANAAVSPKDMAILKAYVMGMAAKNKPNDTARLNAANKQLQKLNHRQLPVNVLPVALNGITYLPDYKNWQAISTTNRFDNGTMRVIFGNTVAVKAIKENNIRPWPKGTIFAKVAWDQIEDKNGNITTGAFKQVEYMIKNDAKYAQTNGWGFARFKTDKMVPYGKTALFATECINCHRPMKDADFVFTQPVKY